MKELRAILNRNNLLEAIENLTIWRQKGKRAPQKPLLILYALGRYQTERLTRFDYSVVKQDLKQLLMEFGPFSKSYDTKDPFVRLHNDGIWSLNVQREDVVIRETWLRDNDISAGFSEEVINLIKEDPNLIRDIAMRILDSHFPESIHEDILTAVGLDLSYTTKIVRKRDPKFRDKILRAYGYSCAVCGYNVRMANQLVGVEAAHIKWHQAGGPDIESNGIALCALHHKLFDHGVFTIDSDHRFVVSQNANGTNGLNEWLMQFNGKYIKDPIQSIYLPNDEFIHWHVKEVFKGEARC